MIGCIGEEETKVKVMGCGRGARRAKERCSAGFDDGVGGRGLEMVCADVRRREEEKKD